MIKYIKYILYIIWRLWFYVLVMLPIIVLFPVLLVLVASEKTYNQFYAVARFWAKFVLFGMGFYYKVIWHNQLEKNQSYLLVANHTSMTDIMLMLALVRNNPFVFVGKKELEKYPIFGFFYKRICILVDRSNSKSRFKVFEEAQIRLNKGLSICIFPEGGVPNEEVVLDHFKDGAFRLAIEHKIPVVAMSFLDNKKRFSFKFFSGSPGVMRVIVHKFFYTDNLTLDDKNKLKETVRNTILESLES